MLWTAFLLGLAGSLHCAGMCGPLALALPATGPGRAGFLAGRLAYNAGRVATYILLGAVFGLVGRSLALVGIQRWVSLTAGALMLAALLFSTRFGTVGPLVNGVGRLKGLLGPLLRRRSIPSVGLLGLLNGLLPCGLVYAAGAAAATVGTVPGGMAYMGLFGLGTVPLMLALGLGAGAFPVALRLRLQRLVPVTLGIVGSLLVLRGLALGIPYLSPDLAGGTGCPDCH